MTVSLIACWGLVASLVLVSYRRQISACWREPVLTAPVFIVESDDWGPGPQEDAVRLVQLCGGLLRLSDHLGNPPVVTLGVVLAIPNGTLAKGASRDLAYEPHTLDAPEFASLRAAMTAGCEAGVFSLQLHGKEHFWPPALLRAATDDPSARKLLQSSLGSMRHERLRPALQSRWIDASKLPSTPLEAEDVRRAVEDETTTFRRVFGLAATVAVPVTFVWTREVEAQWARNGIKVVVTPGTRNVGRDGAGQLVGDGSMIRNGDRGSGGIIYVVRDIYFEPSLGHTADKTLPEVQARFKLRRPAILEMHRFNFTGSDAEARHSLGELHKLVLAVLDQFAEVRFMSTEVLAVALASRAEALIDRRLAARIRALVLRAATVSRLRKLAWVTGLALLAAAAVGLSALLLRQDPASVPTER